MMGFYVILDSSRSLAEFGPKLGAVCACAVYYHPLGHLQPGEANEVHAEGEVKSDSVLIQTPTYVEEETRELIAREFPAAPVRICFLTYRSLSFIKRLAPKILDDPHVWVIDDGGLMGGSDFVRRLIA